MSTYAIRLAGLNKTTKLDGQENYIQDIVNYKHGQMPDDGQCCTEILEWEWSYSDSNVHVNMVPHVLLYNLFCMSILYAKINFEQSKMLREPLFLCEILSNFPRDMSASVLRSQHVLKVLII